jgi:ATP adenylyltransferase
MDYLAGELAGEKPPEPAHWMPGAKHDCFLCHSAAEYGDQAAAERENLVVWRGEVSFAVLNRFPYSNGHVLVSPLRHVAELVDLRSVEQLETMTLLARLTDVLRELVNAQGFNIGLNLGDVAGAGVPGHLHWHLVPRWAGDHNFMSTLAQTRVIPQSLETLWEMLHAALADGSEGSR